MAAVEIQGLREVTLVVERTGKRVDEIARQTLNRAAQRGVTRVKQVVSREVTLTPGYVATRVKVSPATPARPEAALFVDRDDILLGRYSARVFKTRDRRGRSTKLGVTVQVGRSEGRKVLPFVFEITTKGGQDLLVSRRRTAGAQGGKLKVRYGPSVDQIFGTVRDDVREELQLYAIGEAQRRLALLNEKTP